MSIPLLLHIIISGCIIGIMSIWCKFFMKLTKSLDFSYMAFLIFWAYASSLFNIYRDTGILLSILLAFLCCIPFTFLVLYISSKLHALYFTIGTLSLYSLSLEFTYNAEALTWWALGLTWMKRFIFGDISLFSLESFLLFTLCVIFWLIVWLFFVKRSFLYTILQWRGENKTLLQSMGIFSQPYKFLLILLTTFLWVVGWSLYSFYYMFIDPVSFWLWLLVLVIAITFITYSYNAFFTIVISILFMSVYEWMRFINIIEISKIWYMREIIFSILLMIVTIFIFRRITFQRET